MPASHAPRTQPLKSAKMAGYGPHCCPYDAERSPHFSPRSLSDEVTNGAYSHCIEAGACRRWLGTSRFIGDPSFASYPAIGVNWQEAHDYCQWREKRLPTEAEWEAAARGPNGFDYPWGNEEANPSAAHYEFNQAPNLRPVGSDEADISPFGVRDMWGSAQEWLNDWYDGTYYGNSSLDDPQGPSTATRGDLWCCEESHFRSKLNWNAERVIRSSPSPAAGGDEWHRTGRRAPLWFRNHLGPTGTSAGLGFRCARGGGAASANSKTAQALQAGPAMPVYRDLSWTSFKEGTP